MSCCGCRGLSLASQELWFHARVSSPFFGPLQQKRHLWLFLFYKWGLERLNDLPEVTHPVGVSAGSKPRSPHLSIQIHLNDKQTGIFLILKYHQLLKVTNYCRWISDALCEINDSQPLKNYYTLQPFYIFSQPAYSLHDTTEVSSLCLCTVALWQTQAIEISKIFTPARSQFSLLWRQHHSHLPIENAWTKEGSQTQVVAYGRNPFLWHSWTGKSIRSASSIHFAFVFVKDVRKWYSFILLHVAVQFSQNPLLKRVFSPHCYILASFIIIILLQFFIIIDRMCVSLFLGVLCCSIDLCVCFYASTVLFWLQQLCSTVQRQGAWYLQFCSFSR